MNDRDAVALLRPAVVAPAGAVWADLGAGTGVFTRALAALLGPDAAIHAVDADASALRAVSAWAGGLRGGPSVTVTRGDVSRPLALPPLDGVVMANVLHFLPDQPAALSLVASYLRPGGRLVLVEYEGRRPNPWVPHPVSIARFRDLAAGAGFTAPAVVATRPSAYGGDLYVATADRAAPGSE